MLFGILHSIEERKVSKVDKVKFAEGQTGFDDAIRGGLIAGLQSGAYSKEETDFGLAVLDAAVAFYPEVFSNQKPPNAKLEVDDNALKMLQINAGLKTAFEAVIMAKRGIAVAEVLDREMAQFVQHLTTVDVDHVVDKLLAAGILESID